MKKKTKIIIGVIGAVLLIAVLAVAGVMLYLGGTWNSNRKFAHYVYSEGPWGFESTWVSENGNSYLVCDKTNLDKGSVTAWFKNDEEWTEYEMSGMNRMVYLDVVQDGVVVESSSAYMKFDGTTFTIYDLDKEVFGAAEFNYSLTDESFSPR